MRTIKSTGELPSLKIDHKAIAKGMVETVKLVERMAENVRKAVAKLGHVEYGVPRRNHR